MSNETLIGNCAKRVLKNGFIMSKECKHKFHSVYYGTEWEVECEKCDKNVRDLYNKKDANEIVENLLLINNHQRYNYHSFGTAQESIDEENYLNPQTEQEKNFSCLVSVIFFIAVILIFKYLL